jgi:alanine racemase
MTVPASAASVLEIDLDAVRANWRLLDARARPGRAAAVLKADAYGLGAGRVAPALWAEGCRAFFAARLAEAAQVRRLLPRAAVACLDGLMPGTGPECLAHGVVPVLNRLDEIEAWRDLARATGRRLPAIVHLDTGMNRLGLDGDEAGRLAANPDRYLGGLDLRLWMTHLACADDPGDPATAAQAARFRDLRARLPAAPWSIANSSGLFRAEASGGDLARPGAALYGVNPTPEAPNPMRPAVRLRSRVLQVRRVDAPQAVGYGAAHRVVRPGRIATIATGYADGYPRILGAKGTVALAGRTAPVVGRISMDLITVDVTDWPEGAPAVGDLVDLIGPHRDVDAVAAEAGTIGYEILTSLGRRHHRVHLGADAPDEAGAAPLPPEAAWAS